jgi:hypothetical protein
VKLPWQDKPEAQDLFDRVLQLLPDGKTRQLSRTEFQALPLNERVRAILTRSVRFYRGGEEVPLKMILKDQ